MAKRSAEDLDPVNHEASLDKRAKCRWVPIQKPGCDPKKDANHCHMLLLDETNCTPNRFVTCLFPKVEKVCKRMEEDSVVDKRDVPAIVEYNNSAANATPSASSDVVLNYLKCKDFCKFDHHGLYRSCANYAPDFDDLYYPDVD
ncbi:MAG: hypothetical protein Q9169_007928 [Polycauliona sp. 2 TL-2023]